MQWDPVSKQFTPDPVMDETAMPLPGAEPLAVDSGGLPPPAEQPPSSPAFPVMFPPKPAHEESFSTGGKVKSSDTAAAEVATDKAGAAVDAAQEELGRLSVQEGNVVKDFADRRVAEQDRQAEERRLKEERRQAWKTQRQVDDDREIEETRKAKVAAGAAREHFWEGRTGARVFAALLQGINQAVATFNGDSGPTPVERIINEKIQAHREKLIGQWEATKEANELKAKNRDAFEAELDRREAVATKESELSLAQIEDQLKAALAGLDPAKRKAANDLLIKTTQEARAKLREERSRVYDRTFQREETNRSESGNGMKPSASQEQAAADLGEMATTMEAIQKGPPIAKENIKKFANNQEAVAATSNPKNLLEVGMNRVGRAVGLVPEGVLEGIPQDQREQIQRIEKVRTTQQKLISGASVTAEEKKELSALYGIQLDDTPKTIATKLSGLAKALKERTVQAGPAYGPALQQRFDNLSKGGSAPSAPKEGDTKEIEGHTFTFKGGRWQ